MRKLFLLLFSLSIIVNIGYSQGKWKYNPFTRHRDYYVEGLSLSTAASGDIIYYNGTIWTRLAKGANTEVLTLAAGLPSWAAAGGGGDMATDSIWAATGDLAYATGNDTATVLSIGSAADFLRVDGASAPYWDTPGIANTNPVVINHAEVADDDFAKFTASGLEGRSYSETASDLESSIESAIDTLANLISIQAHTFTLAGNFVTQNNNVTINAVDAARTLTLTEDFTIGGGNAGTLTYSAGSKTLTVADNCTVNQDLQTTDSPTFNDLTSDKMEVNEAFTFDAFQTDTGDGDTTINWGLGNNMYFTFGAMNEIIRFTAPPGSAVVRMIIKQDGTGSRTINWANVANILWPGNVEPTLSTTAAYVDIVIFLYDGTSWFGLFNGDFR